MTEAVVVDVGTVEGVVETVDEKADADEEEVVKEVEGLTFEETETVGDENVVEDNSNNAEQPEITYENVWKKNDAKARTGAMELWDTIFGKDMPCHIKNNRVESLCTVAYSGDELVAVSTIGVEMYDPLWVKVGWFRCLVKPKFRKRHIATELAIHCKKALEDWSVENPGEALMAFGTYVESTRLTEYSKNPIWPKTGLTLIGYNEKGVQIRLAWFKHTRVDY